MQVLPNITILAAFAVAFFVLSMWRFRFEQYVS